MYQPDLSFLSVMRRLSYSLLVLLLLAACGKEVDQQWDGPVIELNLTCLAPATKAGSDGTQSGENPYHENLINWVDFYFYPDGVTSAQAGYHVRKVSGKRDSDVFRLELGVQQVDYGIFPVSSGTTEALVFALVNGPETLLDGLTDTSLDAIKQLVVTEDFVNSSQMTNHRLDYFLMSGETTITLAGRNKKVVSQGMIELARYAAKISVGIKTGDVVRIPTTKKDHQDRPVDEIWTPRPKKMQVYLVDGVSNVCLSGNPIGQGGVATAQYHSYKDKPMTFWDDVADIWYFDKSGDYYNTFPMYTYPYHWTPGSEEDNKREPYLKLVLTWDRQQIEDEGEVLITAAQKEFYYKILIPQDRRGGDFLNTFVRNNWYHYNVEVGVLGGDTDEAEVTVPASAFIVYWQNKDLVVSQAEIGSARYLSLDNTTYKLNNQATVDARYVSSHAVDYNIESATRPYYGSLTSGTTLGGTICQATGNVLCNKGSDEVLDTDLYQEGTYYLSYDQTQREALNGGQDWVSHPAEESLIRLNHALKSDFTKSDFDYSPYTILVSLWHKNNPQAQEYTRVVKFIQIPGVYIEAELNSDPIVDIGGGNVDIENQKSAWQNFEHNGYVFIDGARRMRYNLVRDEHGNPVKDGSGKNKTTDGEYETLQKIAHRVKGYTTGDNGTAHKYIQWLQWRTVNFTGGNRNMYNITVSVLPPDSEVTDENKRFVIGDPRTLEVDNLNNGVGEKGEGGVVDNFGLVNPEGQTEAEQYDLGYKPVFSDGEALYGTSPRKLEWYHPADGSDRTKKMIAPSFRVASKFGGMEFGRADIKAATRKCATYQEDGYPAGRWRLPTYAEISFIASLQGQKNFVVLFGNTTYWSAHGAVTVDNNNHKTTLSTDLTQSALARCVYDSWYWDNMPAPYKRLGEGDARDRYVLGDMPLLGDTE